METEDNSLVYSQITSLLKESGAENINEVSDDKFWRTTFKYGQSIVFIHHNKNQRFMFVVFPNQIDNYEMLTKINTALKDEKHGSGLRFTLISTLTTPSTAYITHSKDNGFSGFDILTRIYPLEPGFSMRELDDAIQRVVSVGVLGMVFISEILNGQKLEQKIIESDSKQSSPDGMYF